ARRALEIFQGLEQRVRGRLQKAVDAGNGAAQPRFDGLRFGSGSSHVRKVARGRLAGEAGNAAQSGAVYLPAWVNTSITSSCARLATRVPRRVRMPCTRRSSAAPRPRGSKASCV